MIVNPGDLIMSFTIGHRLVSEANNFDNRWKKKARKYDHRILMNPFFNTKESEKITLPCLVKLTRISPRSLDYDNLVYSFKSVKDYIADKIIPGLKAGRADGDKRITWNYDQEKGKPKYYGYRVEIFSVNSTFPS